MVGSLQRQHSHDFPDSSGQPIAHHDHMDLLRGDELHCFKAQAPCSHLEVVEAFQGGWDDGLFFDLEGGAELSDK